MSEKKKIPSVIAYSNAPKESARFKQARVSIFDEEEFKAEATDLSPELFDNISESSGQQGGPVLNIHLNRKDSGKENKRMSSSCYLKKQKKKIVE